MNKLLNIFKKEKFSSKRYWENRYSKGGNSGCGSYNDLALFKSEIINNLILEYSFNSVIEFGVGDGNQLTLMNYKKYLGLDVSNTAIKICIEKFKNDKSKSFLLYDPECFQDSASFISADVALSLDVIYHLVEEKVYKKYIRDIFSVANKMVIIYSTNFTSTQQSQHVRHRLFTQEIEKNISGWKLEVVYKNKYSIEEVGEKIGSNADFYVYMKL